MVTPPFVEEYPKIVTLRHCTKVELRPLASDDTVRLLRFFLRVPEADRYYFKEDATDPEVMHTWTANIDFKRVIPIVAVLGDEIIADATLHRSRNLARSHIGEYRLVVDPAYRGRGLAGKLAEELLDIAAQIGLHRVIYEAVEKQEETAIRAAKTMGFKQVATLKGRVVDLWGQHQDLVVLERAIMRASNGQTELAAAEHNTVEPSGPTHRGNGTGGPGPASTIKPPLEPVWTSRDLSESRQHAGPDDERLHANVPDEDGVYRGNVLVGVETGGNAAQTMHFLNEIGSRDEIRLLEMAGGLRDMSLLLGLRMPVRLKELFSAMKSVSEARSLPDPLLKADQHVLQVVLASFSEPAKVTA